MAKGGQGPKVAIAIVCFAIAGVAIAWQMGAFSSAPAATPEEKQREQEAEQVKKAVESGEIKPQPLLQADQ